ncbi:MAG: glutamate--tRNA ligase [candidate division Zixibacteria bacterium]|nr:glutamate--tRNA ligase [candidate division Zixibacteria bacterium]
MSEVRVRIAPSPSGFLHVGTARTAIFNWLFARHNGGKFILRIEDTDEERSDSAMVEAITDSLKWLGLNWDEGPIFQSQRWDRYTHYLDRIKQSGRVYPCFCTPAELQAKREEAQKNKTDYRYDRTCLRLSPDEIKKKLDAGIPHAWRLQIPDGETRFTDLVYGEMVKQNKDLEDLIICRSDGRPIYNFAVVVDDHEMGITHVIRGNDHQTNTFKQVLIYDALGFPAPEMAHLPLIFDQRKKKISKRDKAANASDYAKEGYLPEAVVNYLAMLGWSPKDDREIMTLPELIEAFDLRGANKSNAIFDPVKMRHFNAEHIRRKTNHDLAVMVAPLLIAADISTKYGLETRWRYLMDVIGLLKDRCGLINEFVEQAACFFQPPTAYDAEGKQKHFNVETADRLDKLADVFDGLADFTHDAVEAALNNLAETLGVKAAQLIHPVRLAVTGRTKGPGLYELLVLIGRQETTARMRAAARYIRDTQAKG